LLPHRKPRPLHLLEDGPTLPVDLGLLGLNSLSHKTLVTQLLLTVSYILLLCEF